MQFLHFLNHFLQFTHFFLMPLGWFSYNNCNPSHAIPWFLRFSLHCHKPAFHDHIFQKNTTLPCNSFIFNLFNVENIHEQFKRYTTLPHPTQLIFIKFIDPSRAIPRFLIFYYAPVHLIQFAYICHMLQPLPCNCFMLKLCGSHFL